MTDAQGQTINWPRAIGRHREALLRIIAALFAMAGFDKGESAKTLPHHLRNHVLRLLRPAESAARRLIIIAARGVEAPDLPLGGGESDFDGLAPRSGAKRQKSQERGSGSMSLPLLDSLPRFDLRPRHRRPKGFPRISIIGVTEPRPIPDNWIPAPDDEVGAAGIARRLAALKRALDDLDGQARRFARWKAKRDLPSSSGLTRGRNRTKRFHPMRPGRPPGHRKRPVHEVDDILRELHSLAHCALKAPDTS